MCWKDVWCLPEKSKCSATFVYMVNIKQLPSLFLCFICSYSILVFCTVWISLIFCLIQRLHFALLIFLLCMLFKKKKTCHASITLHFLYCMLELSRSFFNLLFIFAAYNQHSCEHVICFSKCCFSRCRLLFTKHKFYKTYSR